jgi:hypothetical protein
MIGTLNGLDPANTDYLVYVYSISKRVAATRDADERKLFAWGGGFIKMFKPSRRVTASYHAITAGPAVRVRPESPSREALVLAESPSREALLRDLARLGQT